MTDTKLLEQQLEGLKHRGKQLREKEGIFLKHQGLAEQKERMGVDIEKLKTEIEAMKEDIDSQKETRNKLASSITSQIEYGMGDVIPYGDAIIRIEGGLFIGWKFNGSTRPYAGLSGGEKVAFDMALSHVLGTEMLLAEAAEMDPGNLSAQLEALSEYDGQVVMAAWNMPDIPDGWDLIEL